MDGVGGAKEAGLHGAGQPQGIGDLLRRHRVAAGMTQEELAERSGVSVQSISNLERGVPHAPRKDTVELLATALGLAPLDRETFRETARRRGQMLASEPNGPTREPASGPTVMYQPELPLRGMAAPPPLAASRSLIGREVLLRFLKDQLCEGDAPVVSALWGLPGVGKTTLALALAHDPEVVARYPDGILWAGLGPHAHVLGLLSNWGAAVGLAAGELAKLTTVESLGRAIHGMIGARRLLLVIDDAWTIEEALAFKVGGSQCAHLATSRFPSIAQDMASREPIAVRELEEDEAIALLSRLAPGVVAAEPHETRTLAQSVGGLPLALTLIGRSLHAQAHSGQPRRVRAALERLRSADARLRVTLPYAPVERPPSLPEGTPLSLHATIAVSDQQLNAVARAALRTLALFPAKPNTFSEEAAIEVCAATAETIDELNDAGLLEGSGAGRYTLHQTIAAYAGLFATDAAAMVRFARFFVAFVASNQAEGGALDREMGNVLAALRMAVASELGAELVRGTLASVPYWLAHGQYDIAEEFLPLARDTARILDDRAGLVNSLLALGRVAERRGHYAEAEALAQESLTLARVQGDADQLSAVLQLAGILAAKRGDMVQAETYYVEGLAHARQIGRWERVCMLLTNLGSRYNMQGDSSRADACYQEGLRIAQEMDFQERRCGLLQGLGTLAGRRGQYAQAAAYFREGLDLARALGARESQCSMLANLAVAAMDQGEYGQAETHLEEGLALARALGHPEQQCSLLAKLGDLMMRENRHEQAMTALLEGLALAQTLGHEERTAALLCMLAGLARRQKLIEQAETYLRDGLALAQAQGHRPLIAGFLLERGALHLSQNNFEAATESFSEALRLAEAVDSGQLQAEALYGLAQVAAAEGNLEEAMRRGQESLRLMEEIGFSMRNEVATWLRTLPAVTTVRHRRHHPQG